MAKNAVVKKVKKAAKKVNMDRKLDQDIRKAQRALRVALQRKERFIRKLRDALK